MIAYIFPGQNSQFAGMGKELAQQSAIAAEVFKVVDDALGFGLSEIMFEAEADALTPTEIQQPAIFAHSVAAFAALRRRHEGGPAMMAGHSLGEYSAMACAGCMGLDEAAKLVRKRGELMAEAGAQVGGAMAAIVKLDTEAVMEIVEEAGSAGIVAVANFNSPGQIVISGEAPAVEKACELAKERRGRAIPLQVSGAFHSPLMQPAADSLQPHIDAAEMQPAAVPVVSNVDATPRTDPEGIKQALIQQVTGSVRWEESVRRMIADGVDTLVEVGPGSVLSKLVKRIDGEVTVHTVGNLDEIVEFTQAL